MIFKNIFSLYLILAFQVAMAQKNKNIEVMVLDSFNPNSSLTVLELENDPLMLGKQIEDELMFSSSKLKIISPLAAKEVIKMETRTEIDLSNNTQVIVDEDVTLQVEPSTIVASLYALSFTYNWNRETGGLMRFSGEIVNMRDGTIVCKFRRNTGNIGFGMKSKKAVAEIVKQIISLSS